MNNMKRIVSFISIAITVLIILLCGCAETSRIETNISQTSEIEELSYCFIMEPFRININSDTKLKDEIIKQIEISKEISEEYENLKLRYDENESEQKLGDKYVNYSLYLHHKISDISEFYNLDNFKIEGFELYLVDIGNFSFGFRFGPTNDLENAINFMPDTIFQIGIEHPGTWIDTSDPLEVFKIKLNQAEKQGWGYLTEDNMLYSEEHSKISAIMGNTILTIKVPEKLNTYEYLRELALQVIEKAELVTVKEL